MSSRGKCQTRPCTVVIFIDQVDPLNLTLSCRPLVLDYDPKPRLFQPNLRLRKLEILEVLHDLQKKEKREEPRQMDEEENKKTTAKKKRERLSWSEEVNIRRSEIAEAIGRTEAESFKDLARRVGCHTATVKSVYLQLVLRGGPLEYNYNNIHTPEISNQLGSLISDPANQFFSTADYKRRVPVCSKRYIRRSLKASGRTYKKLERQRKVPRESKYDKKVLKQVIWTAVQAMARDDESILFLDEAIFPCNQTTDYCWLEKEQKVIYNRRENSKSLHVIGLCSQRGYVAFQVYLQPPNKEAIHYFISQVLDRLQKKDKVVILLDNAGWHLANLVMESMLSKVLLFNVAYCWESNLIENTFSKMKGLWRQRRVVKTEVEEVESLVEVFRSGWNERDFGGYRRQYYRQLERLLALL